MKVSVYPLLWFVVQRNYSRRYCSIGYCARAAYYYIIYSAMRHGAFVEVKSDWESTPAMVV